MGFFDNILHDVGAQVAAIFPHPPPVIHAAVDTAARALLGQPEARAKVAQLGAGSPVLRDLFGQVHRNLMQHPHFRHALSASELHKRPVHPRHPRAHQITHGVVHTMNALEQSLPGLLEGIGRAKLAVAQGFGLPAFRAAGYELTDVSTAGAPVMGGPIGDEFEVSGEPGYMLPGHYDVAGAPVMGGPIGDEFEVSGEPGYMLPEHYDVAGVYEVGLGRGGAHHPAPRARAASQHRGWRHGHGAPGPRGHRMEHGHPHPDNATVFWGGPRGYGADYLFDEREELEDHESPADTEPEWVAQPTHWMGG
jgi:hypothetical protein